MDFIEGELGKLDLGITSILNDNMVMTEVDLNGQAQPILICSVGKNADGNSLIRLISPGIGLTGDESIDGPMALFFLRRHREMSMARWEVLDLESGPEFTLTATLIANTLDTDELRDALRSVADERRSVLKALKKHSIDF